MPQRRDDELRRLRAEGAERDREMSRARKEAAAQRDEIARLRSEAAEGERRATRHELLIERLREEADVREHALQALREELLAVEVELDDLRAIRDALTPPELPHRPGLDLAASFLPAELHVSGDFYLVAEGPADATVLVVGDVMGKGLAAARRAAFVRTALAAVAPFSDDPARLLTWANLALVERAGETSEFVTAACLTYQPRERMLRWAYAGHPPMLWLDTGEQLGARRRGVPLGVAAEPGCVSASWPGLAGEAGVVAYTDGLTEARGAEGRLFGLERVQACISSAGARPPTEVLGRLLEEVATFSHDGVFDDVCVLATKMRSAP